MTKLTPEQLSFVAGIIQTELDERYTQLVSHAEVLPFSVNPRIVELRQVQLTMMSNFSYNVTRKLIESGK